MKGLDRNCFGYSNQVQFLDSGKTSRKEIDANLFQREPALAYA